MSDFPSSTRRDELRQHEETFYRLIRSLLTDVAIAKLGVTSSRANDLLHKLKHLEELRRSGDVAQAAGNCGDMTVKSISATLSEPVSVATLRLPASPPAQLPAGEEAAKEITRAVLRALSAGGDNLVIYEAVRAVVTAYSVPSTPRATPIIEPIESVGLKGAKAQAEADHASQMTSTHQSGEA